MFASVAAARAWLHGSSGAVVSGAADVTLPRLTYFDGRGRAEAVRFVFGLAGAGFTERFVRNRADWEGVFSEMPYGQLPLLEDGALVMGQSMACCRYVARKHGLYGDGSATLAALVDMHADSAIDFYNSGLIGYAFNLDRDKAVASCQKYLPRFEAALKANRARTGEAVLAGTTATYADAVLLMAVLSAVELVPSALEGRPELRRWKAEMESIPTVANFLRSDRRKPSPTDEAIRVKYKHEVNVSMGR
mmetsp:Transcript_23034/g.60173  ORF Transcript_23034/g.60173 Transcript_23034/m.60173 type:complete len:248 (-) Transcript_23034:801-1544(-)